MVKELVGQIRINAKDLDTPDQREIPSPRSGLRRCPFWLPWPEDERFPGMDDVRAMTEALIGQIKASGEVRPGQGEDHRSQRERGAGGCVVGRSLHRRLSP